MKRFSLFLLVSLFSISQVLAQQAKLAPGLDVVGFGYDVFGEYANQKSKKPRQLFEFGQMKTVPIGGHMFQVPIGVLFEHMADHKIKKASGSSIREYSKSLAVKAGVDVDAMAFSASVETNFGKSENKTEKKFYSTYLDINTKWRVSIDALTDNELKGMLTDRARNAINTMDPQQLFKAFGTHFIFSGYLGGRADFTTTTTISNSVNQKEIDIAIEAKYKMVTASTNINSKERNALNKVNITSKTRVLGGNSQYTNNLSNPQQYREWADGIDDMPVLCDFDKNSLRPIWVLADRPERRSLLEAAFKELCKQFPLPKEVVNLIDMSTSLYHIRPKNSDKYIDVSGYHSDAIGNGKEVKLWALDTGADRFIKLKTSTKNPQWVMLQPQHDTRVFEMHSNGERGTGSLTTRDITESPDQLFKLEPVAGEQNTYRIRVKRSGLLLTVNRETFRNDGGKIFQAALQKENEEQWWVLEKADVKKLQPDHRFLHHVRAEKSDKYWDVPGPGLGAQMKGAQMNLWTMDHHPDRYLKFDPVPRQEGWFGIQPYHSPYYFDVNSKNQITLWDNHKGNNQQFTFEYAGEPNVYFIKVKSNGKYIDAAGGAISKNGCKLQAYKFNGSEAQRWLLVNTRKTNTKHVIGRKFYIKCAHSNKYWDISGDGPGTNGNGKRLQIWDKGTAGDRIFELVPAGDHEWWYIKIHNGGRFVDVGGYWKLTDMSRVEQAKYRMGKSSKKKKTDKRAPIQIWEYLGKNNQRFRIQHINDNTFVIINQRSGKAIDVEGGRINNNGTRLHQWDAHKGKSQQFQLIYADGPNKNKVYSIK